MNILEVMAIAVALRVRSMEDGTLSLYLQTGVSICTYRSIYGLVNETKFQWLCMNRTLHSID